MFKTGLVSISFRQETPETIIREVKKAGLNGIEWGGDVHVPPTNPDYAERVGRLTRDAGLDVLAYGSYYRLGCSQTPEKDFRDILETARVLGAPVIRAWAGSQGSADVSPECRAALVEEALVLCRMAEEYHIDVALECHGGTLTDDWRSSTDFMKKVNHPRFKMYWQPNQHKDEVYNLNAAAGLAQYTVDLHVFHWDAQKRYPLSEGTAVWNKYLDIFRRTDSEYGLLLEFMHDDRPESLFETAQTLQKWIKH